MFLSISRMFLSTGGGGANLKGENLMPPGLGSVLEGRVCFKSREEARRDLALSPLY